MKVLLVSLNYAPEIVGVGKYSAEMSEWLVQKGHEVDVICSPPYYPEWEIRRNWKRVKYFKETNNGVSITRCPIYVPRNPSGLKRIVHLLSFWLSSFPVILSRVFDKPDVVIAIEPPFFASTTALFMSKLTGSRSVLHVQDFEIDAAFNLGLIKNDFLKRFALTIEKYFMSRFDVVSTISKKMMSRLKEKGIDEKKILFFPNWVDTNLIKRSGKENAFRNEIGVPVDQVMLLYSGNMGNKQGLEIIIEAAKLLVDRRDVLFLLSGAGSSRVKLMESAHGLDNVKWIDFQPLSKLSMLLCTADIHLLPQSSHAEDLVMPSKLTGMLSSGRPVITTSRKGTQLYEIVSQCGKVVEPGCVDDFVSAIIELVDHRDLRCELGIAAREIAENELDINSVLERFNDSLKNMAS